MIIQTLRNLFGLCLLSGLMVGLSMGQEKQAQKAPEASATLSAGAELYTQHCALCHGDDLKGTGSFPAPYRVPPDLTTLSKRHGGKFPEAHVASVLRNGAVLPAHGPAEMPQWVTTNRADKAHVESRIKELASYIKSRQAK